MTTGLANTTLLLALTQCSSMQNYQLITSTRLYGVTTPNTNRLVALQWGTWRRFQVQNLAWIRTVSLQSRACSWSQSRTKVNEHSSSEKWHGTSSGCHNDTFTPANFYIIRGKGKGKAVPLQAWSGPEGSRKLRFPDFMITAQDGGKFVSLTHRPPLPSRNTTGTHFC